MKRKIETKKIKGFLIKITIMLIISLIFIASVDTEEKFQYMDNLDYQVTVNRDGSMQVVEIWDINVSKVNTLFKNFNLSKTKYGNITDVKVVDLDTGKELTQIYNEMYHVTKDCYYALEVQRNKFEIAWGIGMDDKTGKKKYQVSYVVKDVVTDYKDVQEIYWQFLAKNQNAVPVKKVTGTITLPEEVSNLDKLRVWGHGQLNGDIQKISKNKVEFKVDNLHPNAMLEIRVVTEDKMFDVSETKVKNYNYLNTILDEETGWAEEANLNSANTKNTLKMFGVIYLIIILIFILKIVKYNRINKEKNNKIVKKKIQYFRDIPRENDSTPTEAAYLYNFHKGRLSTQKIQRQAVSATLLDLCLKKIISLKVKDNDVYVKILQKNPSDLPKDELAIFNIIERVSNDKEEFEINELNTYAKKKYYKYSKHINNMVNSARNKLYELKLIDKAKERNYKKYQNAESKFIIFKNVYELGIVTFTISILPIFEMKMIQAFGIEYRNIFLAILLVLSPLMGVMLYSWKMQEKIKGKIAVLTQAGSDEKAEWKGLAKFMEDFSLLDEKELPELVLWEKYLVYATAFGIADKVIEQIKAKYPEVAIKEQWENDEMLERYPVMHFSLTPTRISSPIDRMSSSVSRAYSTSMTQISAHSTSSSGSGGGGGFSSGGGGRRRPVAGMGGR